MSAWCLCCFSENVEERGGGRIRRCRTCGGEAERKGEGWKVTKKGRGMASLFAEAGGLLPMYVLLTTNPSEKHEPVVASQSAAPPAAAAPRTAGPVSRGDRELFDGLSFSVSLGLERLAAKFQQDFSHVWRCIDADERAGLKAGWAAAGGISIVLGPEPLISPASKKRVNGYVGDSGAGLELHISSDTVRAVRSISVLAHEVAHASGEQSELGAWGRAHGWLKGTGMPAQHALDAFYEAGGRDVALTSAQAQRWGFGFADAGGVR